MYKKQRTLSLKSSCSASNNNISCFVEKSSPDGKMHIAVVHKSYVNIITLSELEHSARQVNFRDIGGSSSNYQPLILQAKWVRVGDRSLFVIASQRGIQVFENHGYTLLYSHGFSSHDVDIAEETFARGIASCGNNLLCIGTYDGSILIFHVPSDTNTITFSEKLRGHKAPVSDLCGDNIHLVSADDSGCICVWIGETSLKKLAVIERAGVPCTSLGLWKGILIASFGSGQLQVYDLNNGHLRAEVNAHARWITAIDVAQDTGLVLSVSEDCYVHVWQLSASDSPVISHVFGEKVIDTPLHGGCFLGTSGNDFCVTGYDLREVLWFKMQESSYL